MKFKIIIVSFVFLFGFILNVNAQSLSQNKIDEFVNAYRLYKDISNLDIKVPTVLEVAFNNDFIERFDFAVLNIETNSFEPYYFKRETLINEIPISVNSIPANSSLKYMTDRNFQTYADFVLPTNTQGQTQINISSDSPITSSSLTVLLDNNVALPNTIEIWAVVDGQNRIVVAEREMDKNTIQFPKTTSDNWQIKFTYGQPLRISELSLSQDNANKSNSNSVRFLAQPESTYRIYFDPDRKVTPPVGESGNLANAKDVLLVESIPTQINSYYVIADIDDDGVADINDNCVSLSNPDQQDVNNNGRGDVCDDFDQDSLINEKDNCPNNPNRDQIDTDSDGIGDVCDEEESRITEQHKWIPWIGIGFAGLVLIILFVLTARSKPLEKQEENIQ